MSDPPEDRPEPGPASPAKRGFVAGDPTLTDRTWVLITESPKGGWGINGHANTGADLIAAARRELAGD
jgi:hypothetical protein